MYKPLKNPIVLTVSFFISTFFPSPLLAAPDAKSLLNDCKNSTKVDCNTQHLKYRNTTIIQKPGQTPVTMIQVTEIFKKKPGFMKMITDDGIRVQEIITQNDGYIYVKDPTGGKYSPVKSPIQLDPFKQFNTTYDSSQQSSATDQGDHYEITLSGGDLGKSVDHATLTVDKEKKVVSHMEGTNSKGDRVLTLDMEYQKIGSAYHPKTMHSEAHTAKFGVISDMEVLTDEVDGTVANSNFLVTGGK